MTTVDELAALARKTKGWFFTGYREGVLGIEKRVPEGYHERMSYIRGFDRGDTDRALVGAGYEPAGPSAD